MSSTTDSPPCAPPGLATLLAPTDPGEFFREHWPSRPCVVHGPLARLGDLGALPELGDPERALRACRGLVQVYPAPRGDETGAPAVSAACAARLFARGRPFVIAPAEAFVPGLRPWLRAVRTDLGLPADTNARCIAYATPRGGGSNPHFDQNANFVLQLAGEKVWRIARNANVTDPTERYIMNSGAPSRGLRRYARGAFPTAMPPDATAVTLRPGSVLFVPRGYWHATEALAPAFALNFTFDQPDWAGVLTAALARWLRTRAPWREPALGAGAPPDDPRHAGAQARLAGLLRGLLAEYPTARDLARDLAAGGGA